MDKLDQQECSEAVVLYQQKNDPELFDQIYRSVELLAEKECSKAWMRYKHDSWYNSMSYEDVKQEYALIVLRAIETYDPSRGASFFTHLCNHKAGYALIHKEIPRIYRSVYVPLTVAGQNASEIQHRCGPAGKFLVSHCTAVSSNTSEESDAIPEFITNIPEEGRSESNTLKRVENKDHSRFIRKLVNRMKNKEDAAVIREIFFKEKTVQKLSDEMGVGRTRVRQRKERGLENLRKITAREIDRRERKGQTSCLVTPDARTQR